MKKSPQTQNLEEVLRSSKLVAGGFMGSDSRSVSEIIDSDAAVVAGLGTTAGEIARRMEEITNAAKSGLGCWVQIDAKRRARAAESKGTLVCPWPHPGSYHKTVTTVELTETGESIDWADLNIHLVVEHGFFEGKGSPFRIEPQELVRVIF
jgi:hypothetical protein